MGRRLRASLGGYVSHVLNRGNGRRTVFFKDGDYDAFERILGEALEHVPGMGLLAYTLMPNHWHLVLWPRRDGELSDFGHWLTLTHTQRWHAHYHDIGTGHHQGRFKSFPVAADEHFLLLCRYVERNSLRAGMVQCAAAWRWGSLWRREHGTDGVRLTLLTWAVPKSPGWLGYLPEQQTRPSEGGVRRAVGLRIRPPTATFDPSVIGPDAFSSAFRPIGRPPKPVPP